MFESPVSKRVFFAVIMVASLLTCLIYIIERAQSKPILVFCDVGQGDAAYIRLKNDVDILIDAGPDRKILDCLGKYMPFYDKTIEYAFISHPQRDHFGGYLYLIDRYKIQSFWFTQVDNTSALFSRLKSSIKKKNIQVVFPKSGQILKLRNSTFVFIWPTTNYLNINSVIDTTESQEFRSTGLDVNNFSLVFLFSYHGFNSLFTGDASANILDRLLNQSKLKIDVLKIPHHGSKKALSVELLKLAHPTYGVISVGKLNSYGHPSNDILAALEASKIKIKRTDKDGDIIFKLR